MKHQTALVALVGLVVIGSVSTPIAAEADPNRLYSPGDPPGIYGADAEAEAEIRDAFDLFAQAGLVLPELRIYVHDSTDGCGGWLGLFDRDGSGNRIDLCGKVLLHELAHAWEHHNVTDATRQAYLQYTNLDEWDDRATPHPARGVEHAANDIAWGVNRAPLDAGKLDLYANQLYRYELLTGKPSRRIPHPAAEASLPVVSLEPSVTVLGSPAERAAVEESLSAFRSLEMALPDFTVRFHDGEAGCDDHKGLFDFTQDPWTLEICSSLPFVIAHEMGHAWERARLTPNDRRIYMEARGITEWQNLSLPPGEQGIEDIAFIIQKAVLQGRDINPEVSSAINLLWDLAAS